MTQSYDYNNTAELKTLIQTALTASKLQANLNSSTRMPATQHPSFPAQAWKSLAQDKLLRYFLPDIDNPDTPSAQLPYRHIALAGYQMTRHHHSLGLTMTWLGQLLKCHFLHSLDCSDRGYLQSILNGDSLCALAISEPGAGAHPKHLNCIAIKEGNNFIINGEKSFVSHGPYADGFIVLAITAQTNGRKSYSAFLIPATTPGLQRRPAHPVKGLQPSSHCNIVFNNCRISADTLIGTTGQAFSQISLPMRTLEDSLMLAPIAGAMQAQLDYLAQADTSHNEPFDRQQIGELLSLTESAKELGIIAASKLDQHEGIPDLTPLIIGFRSLAEQAQTMLLEFHDEYPGLRKLAGDIQILSNIGRQATAARTASLTDRFLAEQREKD